jgi:tetratricopeptide (TPR) repeat protein
MDHSRSSSAIRPIFLSSTFVDLQAHRAAVRDIVGRLGQFTLAMEQFGAREGDAQTVSTELVAGCDLYLGVIAWRYGYVPAGQDRSVTHLEYEEAGRLGIPRLIFLAAPETQAVDGPDGLFPASARDPEHLYKLLAFRAEIERAQVVDYFTTPDDLAKKVAAALHQYLQAHPVEHGPRPPRDLPPRAPGYFGHEEELRTLCAALRQGQHMAVSAAVAGMGGVGKSSLAAEAVHALAAEPDAFPGGVTWVRCDDRTRPEGLIWIEDQLLAAWGAPVATDLAARAATPEEGLELRERALRERLRSIGSAQPAPALVLLDNVERDLPLARLLETVTPLGITTLLTSRSEPASPRVRLLRLEVLDPATAVHLFAERYTARGGGWSAERDETAARAIVDALGELPLAIELAAARAARTRLPLLTLAEELRGQDALGRLSDPLNPSASVRYSLSKTLSTLTQTQRQRFADLGLPAGPDWPLPVIERMLEGVAASATTEPQDDAPLEAAARTDLDALIAYSLVGLTAAQGTGIANISRIRLHPLVRELAHEEWGQLPTPAQSEVLAALLAGVHAWVEAHQTQDPSLYRVFGQDEDLIAGALRTAMARKIHLPTVTAIIEAWGMYLFMSNERLNYEMRTLQVESAHAVGDLPAELAALNGLIQIAGFSGREDEAARLRRRALTIARELGDQVGLLRMLGAMGEETALRGERSEAEQLYAEARGIASALGERLTDFHALNNVGNAARAHDRLDDAERWYQRAIGVARATDDPSDQHMAEFNLGMVFDQRGNTAEAQHMIEILEQFAVSYQNQQGLAILRNALGQLALKSGNLDAASAYLNDAEPRFAQTGAAQLAKQVRGNLTVLAGLQALRRGEREAAAQAFDAALRMFEEIGREADAVDQRPFVRRLLAELREQPSVPASMSATPPSSAFDSMPEPVAANASVPRAKRRWWLWRRP